MQPRAAVRPWPPAADRPRAALQAGASALAEAEAERMANPVVAADATPAEEAVVEAVAAAAERTEEEKEEEDTVMDLYTSMGLEDLRDVCKGRNLNYGSDCAF